MKLVLALIFLLAIAILPVMVIWLAFWLTHIDMVKSNTSKYGSTNYKTFIKEFNKYKWNNEGWGGDSFWDRNHGCQYHADIVYFNYIGMIMRTPFDYLMMKLYIKKYFKQNKINNYKWQ